MELVAKQTLVTFAAILLLAPYVVPLVNAEDVASPWFRGEPKLEDSAGGSTLPPLSINGNIDCNNQKIITRQEKLIPPYYLNEQSHESCVVDTMYGSVSQSGYLLIPGETTWGKVYYPWGGKVTLLAVPHSPNAIILEPNYPNGVNPVLVSNFINKINIAMLDTGDVEYYLKPTAGVLPLRSSDGVKLGVQLDSVSFSADGTYMVADTSTKGLTLVDTTNFSYKHFGTGFNYSIGVAPGAQTAVAMGGRYVAVASTSFMQFRLYDTEDCNENICKYYDMRALFSKKIPGFIGVSTVRFGTRLSLHMYTVKQPANRRLISQTVVVPFGHEIPSWAYLALGDSFASGEGAYNYKATTDFASTDTRNKCHVSLNSYPYLIANDLGISQAESIACSGAVMMDINDESYNYDKKESQANGKSDPSFDSDIFSGFLPGYRAQIRTIKEYKPDNTTISISGNDIGFSDIIKKCVMPGTCLDSYEDRLELANEINSKFDDLVKTYVGIKDGTKTGKLYVIGYPEVAKDDGDCGSNVRLNSEEVKLSNQIVRHLNAVVKAAADKAGVFYVNTEKAFYGHRLCETDYSNAAVNGITAGDDTIDIPFTDTNGPIGNESFHPNALGHRKYKEVILDQTNNFTKAMPSPNLNAAPPKITPGSELIKDKVKTGRQVYQTKFYDGLAPDQSNLAGVINVAAGQPQTGLAPDSNVEAWLYSSPSKLDDIETDENGNISAELTIPEDIEPGYHTLHLFGTSMSGRPIDVQKVIYVAPKTVPAQVPEPEPEPQLEPEVVVPPAPVDETPEQTTQESETTETTDEEGLVDQPEISPPADSTTDEQPISENNVKPDPNNRETVAGHEPLPTPETSDTTSQPSGSVANSPTDSPYFEVNNINPPIENNPTPRVAGASTSMDNPGNQTAATTPAAAQTNYWLPIAGFIAASSLLALVIIPKRYW